MSHRCKTPLSLAMLGTLFGSFAISQQALA